MKEFFANKVKLGWFLGVLGVLLMVGAAPKKDSKMVGLGAIVTVVGIVIARKSGAAQTTTKTEYESLILKLAKQNSGRVTVNEIASGASISIEAARNELERLIQLGSCQKQIGTGGMEVYVFPEFENKASKQDVL